MTRNQNGDAGPVLQLGRFINLVAKRFFPAEIIDQGSGHPQVGHEQRIKIGKLEKKVGNSLQVHHGATSSAQVAGLDRQDLIMSAGGMSLWKSSG